MLDVIDPGHGGSDPGAVYNGRQEKDDVLRLGKAVGALLEARGVDVVYTREGDIYETPFKKAQDGNSVGADYFVSIHRNSSEYPNQYSGAEVLVYSDSGVRRELANNILEGMERAGLKNLGIDERKDLVVLRRTQMPAVLVEAGFINSDKDNETFDKNFDELARGIANGILQTLGYPVYTSPASATADMWVDAGNMGNSGNTDDMSNAGDFMDNGNMGNMNNAGNASGMGNMGNAGNVNGMGGIGSAGNANGMGNTNGIGNTNGMGSMGNVGNTNCMGNMGNAGNVNTGGMENVGNCGNMGRSGNMENMRNVPPSSDDMNNMNNNTWWGNGMMNDGMSMDNNMSMDRGQNNRMSNGRNMMGGNQPSGMSPDNMSGYGVRGEERFYDESAEIFNEPGTRSCNCQCPDVLYRVQVGAYRNKDNADRMLNSLLIDGFPAFIVFDDGLYKVQVGAYRNLSNAIAMEYKLRQYRYNTYITTK